jgi:asparagine synthase (glutamine-hydrolysing)
MAARALSPQAWDTLHATLKPLLPRRLRVGRAGDRVHKWASMLHAATERDAYEQVTAPRAALADALRLSAPGAGWWNDAAATRLPDFLRRMQFMDQTGYLVDDALVKVDRASMASGLEVRVPLLDHRLVEFAWSLPAQMKVRHGRGKWLLRQVLARHLHTQALAAPKVGFGVPLEAWLRGPLRSWGGDLVASRRVAQDPLLDAAGVTRM